ncbi:general transcription factor II-I repeat domain-containing protein 2A [Trichonephila clavipes]|nr:general transcription factor II-I repeat domain-containing protein 2A [Trichonephila clavipes]
MQLIDFQSSSIWIQKFIEIRKKLELIEAERLTSNISKNTSNEILETWNSIPDAFNCLKKLAYAILTIFSSTYACESLFSEINSIKDSLRNRLTDDSYSACILLKTTRGLLTILNHGQVTWTTPELAPPLLTTTPHQREDVSALDRFNVHRCPTRRVFSGTGLEPVTKQATVRYLYHSATAATHSLPKRHEFEPNAVKDPPCREADAF